MLNHKAEGSFSRSFDEPYDITIKDLYIEHSSRPRNRKLAEAFYRARLIESWGTGTLRIVEACEERGMPRPEFIYKSGSFIVRFQPAVEEQEPTEFATLNVRQRKALTYLEEHGTITVAQYRNLTGISERQARRDLQAMLEGGILERKGIGKTTYYEMAGNGRRATNEVNMHHSGRSANGRSALHSRLAYSCRYSRGYDC